MLKRGFTRETGNLAVEKRHGFFEGNVLVLTISRSLGFFARHSVFPYASLYVLLLGGTSADVGFINALRPLAFILIIPVAGFLADQQGRVKIIAVATYLSAVTYLFYITATHWSMLAIGNFIAGLIVFHFPAQSALMADSLPPQRRGLGFAIYSAIPGAVAVIAPFFGGYLIDQLGIDIAMRYLYTILLLAYVVSATIQLKFLRETVQERTNSIQLSQVKTLLVTAYQSAFDTIKWMPRSLRVLAVIIALSFTANAMAGPFWVVYGTDVIGFTASEWGLLILFHSMIRIALTIPAGWIVDHVGKRRTLIAAFTLTLPPVLLFTQAQGFVDVLLLLIMLATANAFLVPACSSLLTDNIPRNLRGRVMGALGRGVLMINPVAGGTGGPSVGYIFAVPVIFGLVIGGYVYNLSASTLWIIQFALIMGSISLSILFLQEPKQAER
jgi:MFS family permease